MAFPADAADLCPSATGSGTITELKVEESTIQAKGTWQSGGSAAGVMLEYRFDSDRLQSEAQAGPSGTWSLTQDLAAYGCGTHTLRLNVFPYVQNGVRQIHCLEQVKPTRQTFEVSCAPVAEIVDCQWECTGGNEPRCAGTCTGMARRGKLSYMPFWGVNGEGWQQGEVAEGPFTQAVSCAPGQRISFKVRDRDGRGYWSNVDDLGCGVTE